LKRDEIETTDLVENNAVIEPISNEKLLQSGIECKYEKKVGKVIKFNKSAYMKENCFKKG
jgi:hypothetical protein